MEPRISRRALLVTTAAAAASVALPAALVAADPATKPTGAWKGIHLSAYGGRGLVQLAGQIPKLAGMGLNTLIVEVGYAFDFRSHPELSDGGNISAKQAKSLSATCREHHVRLIPGFDCLGHQSWSKTTMPLLKKYPEFDETPGQFPGNKGIYCRSWCPRHPKVNETVFALLDELVDAFDSDAIHVGMDEVFIISSEFCPRCKGTSPADSFALAVNDLHDHVVGKRKLEMLMWGDRFVDGKATRYGKWEASENGTFPAIDKVPKDIVLCDWHYEKRDDYPSIAQFLKKGFRVWPCGWKDVAATKALMSAEHKNASPRMLGHLCSTWGSVSIDKLAEWPPVVEGLG
ncbi:MAG TPA: family 20 glycosylhydrolase [Tepidisphaeraceae bacterium]|jgi:hypothetical protein|nr:family 20 glycosylhydrolase [Tepidisphaeraceae bacterium]